MKRETGDLAELELDLHRYELRLSGAKIALEKQPMDLLILLVEKHGQLATRDEIVARLWGKRTFFDADRGINTAIRKIRLALHDDPDQPRYIETVVGRGYRFVGPVRQLPNVEPATLVTRLMVVPFRMLRPDPDVAFLAFSVPDAVAAALSGLGSLTVRSSAAAFGYETDPFDFRRIAEEAEVDVVLTGTILRVAEAIRVSCQLIDVPAGTVRGSLQLQVNLSDLFQLQDHLVERIVGSLALSLTAREHRLLKKDVPASPAAYEFYLRANELSRRGLAGAETLSVARDLYVRGLEEDPSYAPAWARLGRCHVLIGKGVENSAENFASAESSFQRALALNPDLALAHSLYAHLEAEIGRAEEAMVRLVGRARAGSTEPSLFAALVQCCRYCGLLEASLAAHERAHNLDPQIATSVGHTLYQLGDYDGALRHANSGVWMLDAMALDSLGRQEEAVAILKKREQSGIPAPMRAFVRAWRALLEGHARESLEAAEETVSDYIDPEGVFYMALVMSRLGETDRALAVLAKSHQRGFCSYEALARNPWLDSLRSHPKFQSIQHAVKTRCRKAAKVYKDAGGAGSR